MVIAASDGKVYEDEFQFTLGRPILEKWDEPPPPPSSEKNLSEAPAMPQTDTNQGSDYDYEAAQAAGVQPDATGHWPDTYKLPNHITFSSESIHSGKNGQQGGDWTKDEAGKWTFTPGFTNLQHYSINQLQDYFKQVEPDSTLNIDPFVTAAARQKASVKPLEGRTEGLTTKVLSGYVPDLLNRAIDAPEKVYNHIEDLAKRVTEASETLRTTGEYNPAPVVETMVNLYGANAPFVKAGTVGIFGGMKARTGSYLDSSKARALETEGASTQEIWEKTGWMRGVDNRWRFEIPDNNVLLADMEAIKEAAKNNPSVKLSDIFQHNELFNAYPQLKDIEINFIKGSDKAGSASFKNNSIGINLKFNEDPTELKKTILHELQHFVQNIEGFAKGASRAYKAEDVKTLWDADVKELRKARVGFEKLQQYGHVLTDEERGHLAFIDKVLDIHTRMQEAGVDLAKKNYMRSAGEVEARNVEKRSALPDILLQNVSPKTTQEIPFEDQIVNMRSEYFNPRKSNVDTFVADSNKSISIPKSANDNNPKSKILDFPVDESVRDFNKSVKPTKQQLRVEKALRDIGLEKNTILERELNWKRFDKSERGKFSEDIKYEAAVNLQEMKRKADKAKELLKKLEEITIIKPEK